MRDRVWAEISYSKLRNNLDQIKKIIGDKSIICMVKDNAYGHGSVNVSKYLSKDDRVKAFAVACMSEAKELRDNGIDKDIIIIGLIYRSRYKDAIINDYVMTISTLEQAIEINEVAGSISKVAKLEIGIDTGMGRIGFPVNEKTIEDIKKISELKNVSIYGFFTHFSVADSDKDDVENIKYTEEQERKYADIIDKVKSLGISTGDISIANSAGVLSGRGENCTSVRPGIILYGLLPSKAFSNNDLQPIMSLKSQIIHIKEIDSNTSISYGRTFVSKGKMKIATISCGYGDGYPRSASNKTEVIVNDKRCKVVGRVTMDMLMVDVTGVDCKVEDEVILIGESKSEKITLQEICDETYEFTYEVMTSIGKRVERVYID